MRHLFLSIFALLCSIDPTFTVHNYFSVITLLSQNIFLFFLDVAEFNFQLFLQTSKMYSLCCSVQFKMVYGLWLGHSNSKRDPGTWAQFGEIISWEAFLFIRTCDFMTLFFNIHFSFAWMLHKIFVKTQMEQSMNTKGQ